MEDCSKVCIYVTNPVGESTPYLVHKRPLIINPQRVSAPEFYQEAYQEGTNYPSAPYSGVPILPNGLHGDNLHPSERALAYDATSNLPHGLVYLDNVLPVPGKTLPTTFHYISNLNFPPGVYSLCVFATDEAKLAQQRASDKGNYFVATAYNITAGACPAPFTSVPGTMYLPDAIMAIGTAPNATSGGFVPAVNNLALTYGTTYAALTTAPVPPPPSTYAKSLMLGPIYEEFKKIGSFGEGGGQKFGYASCHWLKACSGSDMVGSTCSATLSGVLYTGYCFKSDTGTLECGRLAALDNEYADKRAVFDRTAAFDGAIGSMYLNDEPTGPLTQVHPVHGAVAPQIVASTPGSFGIPYRCPTGSPAKSLGVFVSKRPLMAGCMIANDTLYDKLAEVHVPDYCTVQMEFKKGCMLPEAVNFDPSAVQSDTCHFQTLGCTDSDSIHYNPEATIDDGSCIKKIPGCTVHSTPYEGVDSDTPGFRSGVFGSLHRSDKGLFSIVPTGVQNEGIDTGDNFVGQAVVQYDASANVLSSCKVAIEGCMDSTMVNYDPAATYNSNTWCVPIVTGCMMPSAELSSGFPTAVATEGEGSYDGYAANFMYYATVNDVSSCVRARTGCMDNAARNYDPFATVQGTSGGTKCYYFIDGCLNPKAVNYGCTAAPSERGDVPCPNSGATRHNSIFCKYPNEPAAGMPYPPSPPPPKAPSGGGFAAKKEYRTEQTFVVEGTVAENVERAPAVMGAYTTSLGISPDDVNSGRIRVEAYIVGGGERKGPYELSYEEGAWKATLISRRQLEGKRELQSSSTTFEISTTTDSEDTAASIQNTLNSEFNSAAKATDFLKAAGVTVITDPEPATTVEVITYTKSGLTDAATAGVIAGCVIGGVLIIVVILLVLRQRQKKAYAKTVVPA